MIRWSASGDDYTTTYQGELATLRAPASGQRWWVVHVRGADHPIRDHRVKTAAQAQSRATRIVRAQVDGPDLMGRSAWASPQGEPAKKTSGIPLLDKLLTAGPGTRAEAMEELLGAC